MTDKNKDIRVRFAPSPTGQLHVGGLRTALYNYLFAKKNNGKMLLRIEDTDRKRFVEGATENLIKSLEWAEIKWDEGVFLKNETRTKDQKIKTIHSKNYPGVIEKGNFGPYIQSERLEIYKKYAQQLVAEGKAYYCFCEPERLEKMREEQTKENTAPMYDRYCLHNLSAEQINENIKKNCSYTIRLKVPQDDRVVFDDMIRGKVSFSTNTIDDQVLLKSDGFPTYHLANVVDDHLMGITHTIRAEEWLPSTPKHVLLYRAFGWSVPIFAHLPLLLSTEKKKLSKRQGDVAVEDYVKKGYLKEALINFVALLGWNPGEGKTKEIFSMEELISEFNISKVHKAGAVFDLKKLDWINGQYIKKLSLEDLYEKTLPFLKEKDFFKNSPEECREEQYIKKILAVEQERMSKLSDIGDENKFFFNDIFVYDTGLLRWKNMSDDEIKESLKKAKLVFENISEEEWLKEKLEEKLLEAAGENRGNLLWPLRVALTGQQHSPSPFDVALIIGKNESLRRIDRASALLK
ncbi:MAG TPA: glutamate--tRNA ligase [Candidatus Moranbacteria bacterium]|nr:glutamate--tRNA ligase [Candidatus Moranbacteria bacterium]